MDAAVDAWVSAQNSETQAALRRFPASLVEALYHALRRSSLSTASQVNSLDGLFFDWLRNPPLEDALSVLYSYCIQRFDIVAQSMMPLAAPADGMVALNPRFSSALEEERGAVLDLAATAISTSARLSELPAGDVSHFLRQLSLGLNSRHSEWVGKAAEWLATFSSKPRTNGPSLSEPSSAAGDTDATSASQPEPSGVKSPQIGWDQIEIVFTSDERLQVHDGHERSTYSYGEFELADLRNERPNQTWEFFRQLAIGKGEFRPPSPTSKQLGLALSRAQKRAQTLRRVLRHRFRIEDDPIPWLAKEHVFRARFKLSCAKSFEH